MEHLRPKRCQYHGYKHAHTHTLNTRTHLGIRAPAERGQVHLRGLANSNTGGAKSFCVSSLLRDFLTLTYPEDRLPRCNSPTYFLYTHYLWPGFVFYFLVSWFCLFVSFSQAYSNRGPFEDSCAPEGRKETTEVQHNDWQALCSQWGPQWMCPH